MITSGQLVQVAWVTDDLDATEALLGQQFGVGAWTRLDRVVFGADTTTLRGRPVELTVDVSLAYSGDLQLELIEPVRGESIYTEFLAAHGGGLHHVCFAVDDLEKALDAAAAAGVPVLMRGSALAGDLQFAYLDGGAAGAPYVELAQNGPHTRAFFDEVRARCGATA